MYEVMWKNVIQPDRPQMIIVIRRMRIACSIIKVTDEPRISNTYWFSKAKTVTRTQINVTFISTLPALCIYNFPLTVCIV